MESLNKSPVSIADSLRLIGLSPGEMRQSIIADQPECISSWNQLLTEQEIENIVARVSQKNRSYALTDLGNAFRLIDLFGDRLRYCFELEAWYVWDGRRWVWDSTAELFQMAHATVRTIYAEAANSQDVETRKAIGKHAAASEAQARVENMLLSAKPYLTVQVEMLDQHPMLLNVANGVVDLTTGQLLPHDPKYLITKIIEVDYDPFATCAEWYQFIELVTLGDPELVSFLQCALGYSLTGLIDEHSLFFLYGTGANGKTTFTETVRLLLGEYSYRMNIDSLMQSGRSGSAATPDVANLISTRFALSSEIPENRKLNESLIKDLTGGDLINARQLYKNPFSFIPTHKLWLSGNYKPRIGGTDEGIWRRINVIPFRYTFPLEKRKKMSVILDTFKGEFPGIFNWMLVGCLFWQGKGLPVSEVVKEATSDYRNDQDLVQQFLLEKCETGPGLKVEKDALYRAWRDWCEASGEMDATKRSKKWLTHQMTDRGFQHGGGGRNSLEGINLK